VGDFSAPVQFAMLANLADGIRRSTDPTGVMTSVPAFIDGMAQYGVRELTGGTYGPASGIETTVDMIPSDVGNDWTAVSTGIGIAAYCGGLLFDGQRRLLWNMEGHTDGAFNGLMTFDLTPVSGRPTGGLLLPGSLSDIDDVTGGTGNFESYTADGRPGARHTYAGFADDYASSGLVYMLGGGLYSNGGKTDYIWSFDVDSGVWDQVIQHATNLGSGVVAYTITDPTERKILIYKGDFYYQFFRMSDQTLSSRKTFDVGHQTAADVPGLESGVGYDPTRSRAIFVGHDGSKLLNWTIDWSAETITHGTNLGFTGTTTHQRKGVSVIYHPTRDTFICVGGDIVTAANSNTYANLYEFDAALSSPGSTAVTTRALGSTMPVTTGNRGTWGRFALVEDWDVIVGVSDHENAPQVISLTDRT